MAERHRGESAHVVIRRLIRNGVLPRPETILCIDFCGKQASEYDHYAGYEHPDVVHPVCHSCNLKREGERGGWRRNRPICKRKHDPSNWIMRTHKDARVVGGLTTQRVCVACLREQNHNRKEVER